MTTIGEAPLLPDPIYIAGPMTGLPNLNYDKFDEVATIMRGLGHRVENPTVNGAVAPPGATWHWYMRMAIQQVIRCRSMILLPGWERSKGAQIEKRIADDLDLYVYEWEDVQPWATVLQYRPGQGNLLVAGTVDSVFAAATREASGTTAAAAESVSTTDTAPATE